MAERYRQHAVQLHSNYDRLSHEKLSQIYHDLVPELPVQAEAALSLCLEIGSQENENNSFIRESIQRETKG